MLFNDVVMNFYYYFDFLKILPIIKNGPFDWAMRSFTETRVASENMTDIIPG